MRITLRLGDLTTQDCDVVVNAANPMLAPGGGVCGAIYRAAGPEVFEEAERERRARFPPGGVPAGDAVVTGAGRMSARYVVHAVGPVYDPSEDRSEALRSAFRRSVELAAQTGARSVAFPAISTGIYGWPMTDAARLAVSGVRSAAAEVEEVRFVLVSQDAYDAFAAAVSEA